MANWGKTRSSRPIKSHSLAYTGSGTVFTTFFTYPTDQIRVVSQVTGYFTVQETTSITMPSSSSASGAQMPAQTFLSANVAAESLTVSPGMLFAFASTSTSSGYVSIVEMG